MNSFNSTIDSVQDVESLYNEHCTAINETTGELCGEAGSLKIIDEFQKLYEARIEDVDHELENEFDQVCMKLEISKEWIRNLKEQNVMLVQVVEDLERIACNRVKLLEQKLKQSSMIVSENMTKSNHTEKNINTLSNRIVDLEKDEEYMRQKIEFLQSDIRGLLELIRRAVQENNWKLDDIQFLEIQPSDIPAPVNCTCDQQEEISNRKMQSLKLQIERLQEKEMKMVTYQKELEDKLSDLTAKLQTKEDVIKKYISQFQNFSDNLKKQAKLEDQIACNSLVANDQHNFDIVLMADIVERMFKDKDLETRDLQRRLRETESNLTITARDNDKTVNNLKVQLNEKCKTIQDIKQQIADLRKDSLEKQEVLTADTTRKNETVMSLQKQVAMLQEQVRYANVQSQFKEGIIREMRKVLKRTVTKETCNTPNVCVDTKTYQKNQIISYLTRVKSLMEREKEDLSNLKIELEKTIERLCHGKDEEYECDANNVMHKLRKAIECINKMCSRKEESITIIKFLSCVDINGQFKLMDILRTCIIEAQVTMEGIKDEMNVIVSTFKSRDQKYIDLNKEVLNVQNQLIRSQEKVSETIDKLQLQEQEKARNNEKITSGRMKLKDIKNEMNHAQSRFLIHVNKIQNNENLMSGYSEMCTCNDLLCSAIEEIEDTSNSLQGCCVVSDLEELKNQFCEIDSLIKKLQRKTDKALSEHCTAETTVLQEQKLEQLEKEVDVTRSKIQSILETFISSNEQISDGTMESQLYTQTLNEILQTEQNLYKSEKEDDELKRKLSQKTEYQECNEKTCPWKPRVTELQDKVKILKHKTKCNMETNNFLRNSVESMEEELKLQKKIEHSLRQQLNDNEVELKRSKELPVYPHTEDNAEETSLHCGYYQFRIDMMTVPDLFKMLQTTMKSAKCDFQDLNAQLKNLICRNLIHINSSRFISNLLEKFQEYENEFDNCIQRIDKLKNILYSKDTLLKNKDEMIKIQKDSITMIEAELKELHQKTQEKIDNQEEIISQYEKEKKELIKQNELQVQTIGHLQNAVVEAKKCIDHIGRKAMSDVSEQWSTVSSSIYDQGNVHDV